VSTAAAPVSVVVPALGDTALLADALGALVPELARRAADDEVIVVDDTGENRLAPALAERFPSVRWIANPRNVGFARALDAGVRAARHGFVFALNSDVRVREGFLEPLLELVRASPDVFAAVPRVLLRGEAPSGTASTTRSTTRRGDWCRWVSPV
jgi:GT2 family glycosyltransferase